MYNEIKDNPSILLKFGLSLQGAEILCIATVANAIKLHRANANLNLTDEEVFYDFIAQVGAQIINLSNPPICSPSSN
jgi:hypothetical protein